MNEISSERLSLVVEREIAFPPEKVWRALTQPLLIEEWLMKNDFEPVVGHNFNLSGEWGGVLDCEVLAVEQDRTLAYTWNFKHEDAAYDLRSVVTFTLAPTNAGTRLRMEQTGFQPDQPRYYHGARAGWPRFLAALEQLLSRMD